MSENNAPTPQPINFGEHIKLIIAVALGLIAIVTTVGSMAVKLYGKASSSDVIELGKATTAAFVAAKESTSKRIDRHVARAIQAHSSVNAHHGVSGMIVRYAPSKVEFFLLKQRVAQIEQRHSQWRKDIKDNFKEIKATLRTIRERLPHRTRGTTRGKHP